MTAAKHAARAVWQTLRLELNGRQIRVCEVAPGMVATEEFSLVRFHGDAERAAAGGAQPGPQGAVASGYPLVSPPLRSGSLGVI